MRTAVFGGGSGWCVGRIAVRLARPLRGGAVGGFKMAMSIFLPARTVMRRTAHGASDDIIGLRKAFAAYGAGLPFIKEHNNGILSVYAYTILTYYTAFSDKFQQKKHKFKEILKIP